VKTTVAPKFGSLAQRWGRAGLGKGRAGWNPGPPFPPLIPPPPTPLRLAGWPVRPAGPSLPPWQVMPTPPRPRGREEEGGLSGGMEGWGEGGDLEEGVHGLGPCTTPSFGCPSKLLLKLDDFSIFFGNFLVPQTKIELFGLTVGIFIL
jgi:hypothetical protein